VLATEGDRRRLGRCALANHLVEVTRHRSPDSLDG
jgi:hypothetical protein